MREGSICSYSDRVARRFDSTPLRKTTKTTTGALVGEAVITKVGIFSYRRKDGSIRLELRDEAEVSKSAPSFVLSPMTLLHPKTKTGFVTSKDAKDVVVGTIGTPRLDGDDMIAEFHVLDVEAVEAVESGEACELSCGYDADFDPTPGVWRGQRYDGRQTNIRGNHVAIVPRGRAGSEARIRLDAADDAELINPQTTHKETSMFITIGGVKHKIDNENASALQAAVDALDSQRKDAADQVVTLKKQIDETTKTATDTAEKLATETKRADAAEAKAKPEEIAKFVKARANLLHVASCVELDEATEKKLDSMTDDEIKLAVIKSVKPNAKLEGKTPEQISARFDSIVEDLEEEDDGGEDDEEEDEEVTSRRADAANVRKPPKREKRLDSADHRQKMIDEDRRQGLEDLNKKS